MHVSIARRRPTATSEFDPFRVAPFYRRAGGWPAPALLLAVPLTMAVAVVITTAEGTFGSIGDFQPIQDARRLFGWDGASPAAPYFPLLRDYPSWILVTIIATTWALVHLQWQRFRACLPSLEENGVIRPRPHVTVGRLDRLLRLAPADAPTDGDALFRDALHRAHRVLDAFARMWWLVAIVAGVVTFLLVQSEDRNGVFQVLTPSLHGGERTAWIDASYDSWWAGKNHLGGLLLYTAIACGGIFVILLQNVVGFAAVYVVLAMGRFLEFDADWANSDGRYGWAALNRAFQTVFWSLAIHGVALSLLLVTLGIENFRWVLTLVLLYLVVLPLYTVVPWLVFRRVQIEAVSRRQSEIEAEVAIRDWKCRLEAEDWAAEKRAPLEQAQLHPLHVRRRVVSPIVAGVLLPIVLAVLQIFFDLTFGGN